MSEPANQQLVETSNSAGAVRCSAEAGSRPSESEFRLSAIDPFRGAAAFAVLFFHANQGIWRGQYVDAWNGQIWELLSRSWGQIASYLLCGFGFLGVHLFFVISGFCIHLPFAGNAKSMSRRAWIVRRLVRLYPAYFVAFNVGFALTAWHKGWGNSGATWTNYSGHLGFWFFGVEDDGSDLGIIPVLWTIGVEMQLYLLYIVLLPVLRRFGIGRITVGALAFELAYRVWWGSVDWTGWMAVGLPLAPRRFVLARLGEWLLGAWIAEAYARRNIVRFPTPAVFGVVLAAIAVVSLTGIREWWLDVPVAAGFAMWLSSRVQDGAWVSGSRSTDKVLARIGEFSYSLYLIHTLVLVTVFELFARAMHLNKNSMAGQPVTYLVVVVSCILALIVAYGFYLVIERPSHIGAKNLYRFMTKDRKGDVCLPTSQRAT